MTSPEWLGNAIGGLVIFLFGWLLLRATGATDQWSRWLAYAGLVVLILIVIYFADRQYSAVRQFKGRLLKRARQWLVYAGLVLILIVVYFADRQMFNGQLLNVGKRWLAYPLPIWVYLGAMVVGAGLVGLAFVLFRRKAPMTASSEDELSNRVTETESEHAKPSAPSPVTTGWTWQDDLDPTKLWNDLTEKEKVVLCELIETKTLFLLETYCETKFVKDWGQVEWNIITQRLSSLGLIFQAADPSPSDLSKALYSDGRFDGWKLDSKGSDLIAWVARHDPTTIPVITRNRPS